MTRPFPSLALPGSLVTLALCASCSGGHGHDASVDPVAEIDAGPMTTPDDAGVAGPLPTQPDAGHEVCFAAASGTVCGADMHCLNDVCTSNVCGDGIGAGSEQCDDGNVRDADGCDATCALEPCPDGPNGEPTEDCEGGIRIDVAFNQCPRIVSYTAAPAQADVGKRIELFATAEDGDGDAFRVRWSAKDGDFDNRDAPNTTYGCTSAGAKVLDLTVTDRDGCEDTAKIRITCVDVAGSIRDGVETAVGVSGPSSP